MNTIQIIIVGVFFILLISSLRKYFQRRGIKQYSAKELHEILRGKNNILLLDVRTKQERSGNMIKESFHIPLHELSSRINELEIYRSKEIVCYCRTGNRSLTAASKLKKFGFNVSNLEDGIIQWKSTELK